MVHGKIRPITKSCLYAEFRFGIKYLYCRGTAPFACCETEFVVCVLISRLYALIEPRMRPSWSAFSLRGKHFGQSVDFTLRSPLGDADQKTIGELRIPLAKRNAREIAGVGGLSEQVAGAAFSVADHELLER